MSVGPPYPNRCMLVEGGSHHPAHRGVPSILSRSRSRDPGCCARRRRLPFLQDFALQMGSYREWRLFCLEIPKIVTHHSPRIWCDVVVAAAAAALLPWPCDRQSIGEYFKYSRLPSTRDFERARGSIVLAIRPG